MAAKDLAVGTSRPTYLWSPDSGELSCMLRTREMRHKALGDSIQLPCNAPSSSTVLDCMQRLQEREGGATGYWMASTDLLGALRGMLGLDARLAQGRNSTSHTSDNGAPLTEGRQRMDILGLPDGVMLSVLDCLSPRELVSTCCLVSQGLRDAATSNDLWRNNFDNLPEVSNEGRIIRLSPCVDTDSNIISHTCRSSGTS